MGRKQTELGALAVSKISRRGINFVGGVAGLGINVCATGGRSWILRYQIKGRRRDLGLGGYPDVTLAQAREAARAARAKIKLGIDPVDDARVAKAKLIQNSLTAMSFAQAATQYIDTQEGSWRSAKHCQQWRNTIGAYANPIIGRMPVRDVGLAQVLAILEPIWHTKTDTGSRLRGRIQSILDWAAARGYRDEPNPARWAGHLDKLLPTPGKIRKAAHHRALPYAELPNFMKTLADHEGMGARALEFTILTACRSGEVRGAMWAEFDLGARVWTIPAERMKAGKEHRVPLSEAAMDILTVRRAQPFCDYVFPNPSGHPLSDMTLSAVLRRMKVAAVPHGFRSTFRDWCAEQTDYPREVAEMALAHAIGSKVEAAYRRGDLFGKRTQLMQDWAIFAHNRICEGL